ncbi:hypothetical protein LTR95_008437 [Oleoguttula sp. CCFEE 5521]
MSKAFLRDKAWRPFKEGLTDPAKYNIDPRLAWVYAEPEDPAPGIDLVEPFGEPYEYDTDAVRLPEGEKSFRLLQILPGHYADAVHCTLQAYTLAASPPYEALSYCWGDVPGHEKILIDGRIMIVTKSLRAALRWLRKPNTRRRLWVDAVCINQADVVERSAQVAIMGDIYRRATQTTIWLGAPGTNSHQAFTATAGLARTAANPGCIPRDLGAVNITYMLACMLTSEYAAGKQSGTTNDLPQDSRALEALRDAMHGITDRAWFERVWVVQEVALATQAVVVCGSDTLPWTDFLTGTALGFRLGAWETNMMGFVPAPEPMFPVMIAQSHREPTVQQSAATFLGLLHEYRLREATNPVDKVYSMLGLVGPNVDNLGLIPDYTLPFQQVFRNAAAAILIHDSNLDILGMTEPLEGLPSWVPDWSRPSLVAPLTVNISKLPLPTHASRNTMSELRISGQGDVLILKGHIVDRITEIAAHVDYMQDWFDDMDNSLDFVRDPEELSPDATLTQSVTSAWKDISNAFEDLSGIIHVTLHELFRSVEPLQRFVEWENLAKVHEKASKPAREDRLVTYMQTLTAGCYLPGGPAETRLVFDQWFESLSPIRTLTRAKLAALPKLYKPLAFAGYVRKTWQSYAKFNDVLEHAYNRRMGRTAKGRLALVPKSAAVGDLIVLCKGGRVPLCLRPVDEVTFTLLGEAYVHGVVNGEAFDEELCEAIPIR